MTDVLIVETGKNVYKYNDFKIIVIPYWIDRMLSRNNLTLSEILECEILYEKLAKCSTKDVNDLILFMRFGINLLIDSGRVNKEKVRVEYNTIYDTTADSGFIYENWYRETKELLSDVYESPVENIYDMKDLTETSITVVMKPSFFNIHTSRKLLLSFYTELFNKIFSTSISTKDLLTSPSISPLWKYYISFTIMR